MTHGSVAYDRKANLYFFGKTAGNLVRRSWMRDTPTFGTSVVIDSSPANDPWISAKFTQSEYRIEFIYIDGVTSPYAVMYDFIQLNRPPYAPTLVTVGGTGSSRNVSWQHNDPENDTQAKYQLRWRKVI
jgi:hypothetical protein